MIEGHAVAGMLLKHRGLGLLDLKEQGIVVVCTHQQDDPAGRADTADAHHLAGHVDDPIARQKAPPAESQRLEVRSQYDIERVPYRRAAFGVALANDQRHFLDDAMDHRSISILDFA